MTNIAEARRVIEQACALGASDFCVCAGSRNAPLLAVLAGSDLRIYSFVDERSAAFFALGRAKLTGRPAAVARASRWFYVWAPAMDCRRVGVPTHPASDQSLRRTHP